MLGGPAWESRRLSRSQAGTGARRESDPGLRPRYCQAAALAFATSSNLKHVSAQQVPDAQDLRVRSVGRLVAATVRNRWYLGGIVADAVGLALQLLALHLGRRMDAGTLRPEQVSYGKLNSVREALAIAHTARTILGANGVSYEYPVMRHAANLESVLTYEGTPEMHQLVIGKALTGQDAFR